jgi:hypothetical protein
VAYSTSPELRCPGCQALIRPDADWCTLCYADLRAVPPEPVPVSVPVPVQVLVSAEPVPVSAEPVSPEPVSVSPLSPGLVGVDVEAMFAQLAIESASGLGPLTGRLQSKGSKVVLITAGVSLVCAVLVVVMAVLGVLL